MGKSNDDIKHTRKVILLKYKDRKETLILSKSFKRKKEQLTIKVKCNTKIKKSLNESESKEKYPLFQSQLRDRVVPCCFRTNCTKKQKFKRPTAPEKYKYREKKNDQIHKRCEISLSSISSMSNELNSSYIYENVSSDESSFSTDDDIENLIMSTRKRMKDIDDNWKLLQKQTSSLVRNKSENFNSSINSLDTLVLDIDDTNEYSEMYDLQSDVYSFTIKPETKIKYESFETNNNDIKLSGVFMDEQTLYNNNIKKDSYKKNKIDAIVTKLDNDMDIIPNLKMNNVCIKREIYDDL
ncbi:unnamed protein product [Euphydryas editha]|uniref:Uncharacterized protein n=1 Tax=Euphydryas editha TaxID=104508 RepID=A0AAU9U3B6_EUPED|nr:unnamed protein product [Euphydryas editha]